MGEDPLACGARMNEPLTGTGTALYDRALSAAPTPMWRRHAARALQATPPVVRRAYWRRRRAAERAARRALEAHGDFSASRPANFGMDGELDRRFGSTPGFFVEAGAYDGFLQSNTYFLERARGWRGVLVEPVPLLAREAQLERPASTVVNAALVAADHPEPELRLRYAGTMTVVADEDGADSWAQEAQRNMALDEPTHEFTVQARTLSSILDEVRAPPIDLLSLDVEGYEPQVLGGLDLSRHAPRLILVEVELRTRREEVEALLSDFYGDPAQFSPNDLLFERR